MTKEETDEDTKKEAVDFEEQPAKDGKEEKSLDLSDFKVLIVEDYQFISDILSASLREMGIGEVVTAANGELACTKLQTFNQFENDNNVDVIILDWLMPVMDGRAFLKWLREHKSDTIRFIPVVVCSAYTSEALVIETRDMGANEVIVKPISATALAKRIQYVINKPRPYVKSPDFFGPDRRRQLKKYEGADKRKTQPQDIKNSHEKK